MNRTILSFLIIAATCIPWGKQIWATSFDTEIRERKQFNKSIRTRMPPQLIIDEIQKRFQAVGPEWKTFWSNFVVEDDEERDEFVIIARSVEKPWSFGMWKPDCPKPEDYDKYKGDIEQKSGTHLRIDALIGVKRKRSWFRYIINVYDPMFLYWKNPCYIWNSPPGKLTDDFYKDNYRMDIYASNLKKEIYDLIKDDFASWKPPKKNKKIPAMKGPGHDLVGEEAEALTDEEKQLPIDQQEKILEQKRKGKSKKKK